MATTGYFQGYTIGDDLSLTYTNNVSLSSDCPNANYIAVSSVSPYTVYGTPYSTGCSSLAITVDDSGALQAVMANATYDSDAGVHGSDVSPDGGFFYSADDMGNGVWVHAVDETAGTVEEIQHLDADDGSDPRHLAVHPNGDWVYVVYEAASSIAVYSRDNSTGMLTFTNTTYSLLPDGKISHILGGALLEFLVTNSPNRIHKLILLLGRRGHLLDQELHLAQVPVRRDPFADDGHPRLRVRLLARRRHGRHHGAAVLAAHHQQRRLLELGRPLRVQRGVLHHPRQRVQLPRGLEDGRRRDERCCGCAY